MKTLKNLKDLVIATKCRKGQSAGSTKNGAYWLACEPIKIGAGGADGTGDNAAYVTFWLRLRHFRDGAVRPQIHRHAWHDEWWVTKLGGQANRYHGVDHINICMTIEDVVVALKAVNIGTAWRPERVYDDYYQGTLEQALTSLGMPISMPAPDEGYEMKVNWHGRPAEDEELPAEIRDLFALDPYLHPMPHVDHRVLVDMVKSAQKAIAESWGGNDIPMAALNFLHHLRVWGYNA